MLDGEIKLLEPDRLVTEVLELKYRNYRLIQICAAKAGDNIEITYSFGKEYRMVNLRLSILPDTQIVSISDIYEYAFLYENEIHDLFGVNIKMISVDYKGNLYRIREEAPFSK